MAANVVTVKRKDLGFWDKTYLPAVFLGIWITSKHFFFNLLIHSLHRLGLFKNVRAAVTYQYPEEQRPLSKRVRTRHRLVERPDGSPRCVACM
ncbi:MAG: hypothetical protein HY593_03210, partial [Candidatus Omnitrophica bacterium]|nr:hypothetical protein [Candidatus Omnitrophota bacterium]